MVFGELDILCTVWKVSKYWVFYGHELSRIWTEYGDLRSKYPYSVQMQENTDQKNSVFEHFSCSDGVSSIVPKIGHFLAEGLQTGRN